MLRRALSLSLPTPLGAFRAWLTLLTLTLLLWTIIAPIRLAFTTATPLSLSLSLTLDYIVGLFCFLDVSLSLSYGYTGKALSIQAAYTVKTDHVVKGSVADELKRMLDEKALERRSGAEAIEGDRAWILREWGFILDVVPMLALHRLLPLLAGCLGVSLPSLAGPALSALAPLLKVVRLAGAAGELEKRAHVNPALARLAHLILASLIIALWVGCGWVLVSDQQIRRHGIRTEWQPAEEYLPAGNATVPAKVVRALYWGFSAITSGAETSPTTTVEVLYTLSVLFLGMSVYASIIGNVGSLLSTLDRAAVEHEDKLEKIQAYLRHRMIPPSLQDRIIDYYDYVFTTSGGLDEQALLEDLPTSIRTDIALYLNKDVIRKVPFLKSASESFISVLVRLLKSEVCAPSEWVIKYGDIGKEMYFINSGIVSVISADGSRIFNVLGPGSFFGEYALLYSQTRTASIRAETYCSFFVLHQSDFESLLEDYPAFADVVRRHGLGRILAKIDLFQGLTDECVEALLDAMVPEAFNSNETIVQQGELGHSMYFIIKGTAEVIIGDNPHNRRVVKTLTDGDSFGELALIFDQPRSATVRAVTTCDAFTLSRREFSDVMEEFPLFKERMIAQAENRQK